MRDSGLDVSFTLRESAIRERRQSFKNTNENKFKVGTYKEMIPTADLVINLTPDKQHTDVVNKVMPLMKKRAALSYSHGFNIVEEGTHKELIKKKDGYYKNLYDKQFSLELAS